MRQEAADKKLGSDVSFKTLAAAPNLTYGVGVTMPFE